MSNINSLLEAINLEQIEENIFRGISQKLVGKRVFGGQVLAQSLQAAQLTVTKDRVVHSMHGYFILPGDVNQPIIYMVERLRDGGSFTTRRITAIQNGKAIFNMAASFQKEEKGIDHQIDMPKVPMPDDLITDYELLELYKDQVPPITKAYLSLPRPIEFRPVEKNYILYDGNHEPLRHVWMKAKGVLPDSANIHRAALAYASDYNLLTTAMKPHPIAVDKVMLASLDHAMWFHRDFRMDEWLLYALDSPSASNARGFTRGSVFDQSGRLVASVVQEGLIRVLKG
jgi:acyl-CoA thioesterase-2